MYYYASICMFDIVKITVPTYAFRNTGVHSYLWLLLI